jgi:hypothetical protein
MPLDLTDEEAATLTKHLRQVLDYDPTRRTAARPAEGDPG